MGKDKSVCVDCGAKCKNRRNQEVVLCRSCWYKRRSEEKQIRDSKKVCSICGTRISDSAWRKQEVKRCKACMFKDKAAAYSKAISEENETNPIFCVVCGKQIMRTELFKCKTRKVCSKECGLVRRITARVASRESKEALEQRIIDTIVSQGKYTSLATLRKLLKISDKLVYRRGISIPELNFKAGVIDYLPDDTKTLEELEPQYAELLKNNKSLSKLEAAKLLGVSIEHLSRIGLSAKKLRHDLGIFNGSSRTRQEVIDMCVPWIREQGTYVPFEALRSQFHLDFNCSLVKNGLTISDLNNMAGMVENPHTSYWERTAARRLKNAFPDMIAQKSFSDLVSKSLLRFDFFLPSTNTLIEVDGQQHYDEENGFYSEEHTARDRLKDSYVAEHPELTLIRIPITPAKTFEERLATIIADLQRASTEQSVECTNS